MYLVSGFFFFAIYVSLPCSWCVFPYELEYLASFLYKVKGFHVATIDVICVLLQNR